MVEFTAISEGPEASSFLLDRDAGAQGVLGWIHLTKGLRVAWDA